MFVALRRQQRIAKSISLTHKPSCSQHKPSLSPNIALAWSRCRVAWRHNHQRPKSTRSFSESAPVSHAHSHSIPRGRCRRRRLRCWRCCWPFCVGLGVFVFVLGAYARRHRWSVMRQRASQPAKCVPMLRHAATVAHFSHRARCGDIVSGAPGLSAPHWRQHRKTLCGTGAPMRVRMRRAKTRRLWHRQPASQPQPLVVAFACCWLSKFIRVGFEASTHYTNYAWMVLIGASVRWWPQ